MKLKIDENLPAEVAVELRVAGYDAHTVHEEGLSAAPDTALMARIQAEGRALLTMDKGIANIAAYPPQNYPGLILFRPSTTGRGAVLEFVRRHLASVLPLIAPGVLLVVSENGIRLRR